MIGKTPLERKRNLIGAAFAVLAIMLVGAVFTIGVLSAKRADVATTNALTLAEQVKTACAKGPLLINEQDLCQKAEDVAAQPAEAVAGPKGDQGDPGPQGVPGVDGTDGQDGTDGAPGDAGKAGPPGSDGTDGAAGEDGASGEVGSTGAVGASGLNGTDGKAGATGATGAAGEAGPQGATGEAGPAGPPGKDGKDGATGAIGPAGMDGLPGVGISSIECVGTGTASYWHVTYTDGTTQNSDGPCRLESTVVETPTEEAAP